MQFILEKEIFVFETLYNRKPIIKIGSYTLNIMYNEIRKYNFDSDKKLFKHGEEFEFMGCQGIVTQSYFEYSLE